MLSIKKPTVVLGLPTGDYFIVCKKTCMDLIHMMNYSYSKNVIGGMDVYSVSSPSTERNRTALAEFFMESNADYMMQIDMDMAFPADVLEKMIAVEKSYKEPVVVAGIGFIGAPPYNPAIYKFKNPDEDPETPQREIYPVYDWPEEPFEADAVGSFGFIVPRKIMEAIPRGSWFVHTVMIDQRSGETREVRHDFSFCKRVQKAGFKIICDPRIKFDHLRAHPIGEEFWKGCRPPTPDHPDFNEGCKQYL